MRLYLVFGIRYIHAGRNGDDVCALSATRLRMGVPYFFLKFAIVIHNLRIVSSRHDALKAIPNEGLQKIKRRFGIKVRTTERHPTCFLASLWFRASPSARPSISTIICFFVSYSA
jgi:hypothetical protein